VARNVSIQSVHDRADLRQFLRMTSDLYADDPAWVQPLTLERLMHLDPRRNPSLKDIEVAYWMVFHGARCVGRISAQINRAHLACHDDATGHFGFLEAIDHPEVFELLLSTAELWLEQRGIRRVTGPFSLSINDQSGLLIEGFADPPTMMMPHGRPYYDRRLKEQGYAKAVDLIAYDMDLAGEVPPAGQKLLERGRAIEGLSVRPLDFRRFEEEIALVCDIFNDAWAENWGFIPFSSEEAQYMAKQIRPLVTPECFAVAELAGEPIAMTVTLPDINEAIADLDGRLLPFGFARLFWRLKVRGVRRWRMPLMGVRRRYQGNYRGSGAALAVIDRVRTYHRGRGVVRGELSWVLEHNTRMRRIIEIMGCIPYKTYRVYEKELP